MPLQSYQSTSALGDASVIDFDQQTVEHCCLLNAHQFQHYADDDRNHTSLTITTTLVQLTTTKRLLGQTFRLRGEDVW